MMQREIKISPSLLSADFANLEKEIYSIAEAGADLLHLDVMDGHYVPNLTFGTPVINSIKRFCPIPLDVHLMVTNPQDYVELLAKTGVRYLSYHPETVYHNHRLVWQIKDAGMKAGWVINPAIAVDIVKPMLEDLDFVLLMSVNPGFGGQSFIPSVLSKIRELRRLAGPEKLEIEIDGGVSNLNAGELIASGADILVSGAYIFKSDSYQKAIRSLKDAE